MTGTDSNRYVSVIVLILSVVVISVIVVGIGAVSVHGFLWDVDQAEDIQIGSEEEQTISGVEVYSAEHRVTVKVGSLVAAGAEFDNSSSAYDIGNGQKANNSEVFIKDPNTSNATIVVDNSALDNTDTFDIKITNVNTTNVNKYEQNLSSVDRDLEYTVEQDGYKESVSFNTSSSAEISITEDSYNHTSKNVEFKTEGLDNSSSNYIVIWNRTTAGYLGHRLGSVESSQNAINITNTSVDGETDLAVTVHPGDTEANTDVIHAADSAVIPIPTPIKITQQPIYYANYSTNSKRTLGTVVFPFNTQINSSKGHVSIEYLNSSQTTIDLGEDNKKYNLSDNRLSVYASKSSDVDNSETLPYIKTVSISNIVADSGGENISQQEYHPNRLGTTISNDTNTTIEQGSDLAIVSNPSNYISVNSKSENKSYNVTHRHDRIWTFNATGISQGTYVFEADSQLNGTQLEVINSSISTEIPDTTTSNNLLIQFNSTTKKRHIAANISDSNETQHSTSEFILNNSKKSEIFLNISETGEYDVQITDVNSEYTATHSTQVLEEKHAQIRLLPNSVSPNWGTAVDVGLSNIYDQSVIKLINLNNQSTTATIELATSGDDVSSVGLNTYAAGNSSLNDDLVITGSDTTVESIATSTPNGTLPPGTYEVAVRSEHGIATTTDNTTFTLRNRSTNGMTAYTAAELDRSGLGTADAVRDAIANETLSPSSTVSANDTVVYAVNASGLTGLPAARNATLDTGGDLERLDGLAFGVQPASSTSADTELATTDTDGTIGPVPNGSTVHVDEEGLYLVSDGDDALATDGEPTDGEEYTAGFRVDDDDLRNATTDPSAGHTVTTELTYVESETERDLTDDDGDGTTEDGGSTGDDGAGTGGGGTGGGGTGGGGAGTGGGTGGGGAGGSGGTTGGGTPSGNSPTETTVGKGPGGTGIDSSRAGHGPEITPVADLRTPYRDRPNATRVQSTAENGAVGAGGDETASATASGESETVNGGTDGRSTTASREKPPGSADETNGSFAEPDAPGYDDAPIRSTAYDLPGFGPVVTLLAFAGVLLLAVRREDSEP